MVHWFTVIFVSALITGMIADIVNMIKGKEQPLKRGACLCINKTDLVRKQQKHKKKPVEQHEQNCTMKHSRQAGKLAKRCTRTKWTSYADRIAG